MLARIRVNEWKMRMTPKAELISARLLRYTVEDHRADYGWLAKAAAKLILEQAEEIERLKPALAGTKLITHSERQIAAKAMTAESHRQ
jgi:hypothetical protein